MERKRLGPAEVLFQHETIATQILPLRPPYPNAKSPIPLPQSDPQIVWQYQTLLPFTFVQDFVMFIRHLLEVQTYVLLAPRLLRVSSVIGSHIPPTWSAGVSHFFWCGLVTEARHSISWQKDCLCFCGEPRAMLSIRNNVSHHHQRIGKISFQSCMLSDLCHEIRVILSSHMLDLLFALTYWSWKCPPATASFFSRSL